MGVSRGSVSIECAGRRAPAVRSDRGGSIDRVAPLEGSAHAGRPTPLFRDVFDHAKTRPAAAHASARALVSIGVFLEGGAALARLFTTSHTPAHRRPPCIGPSG